MTPIRASEKVNEKKVCSCLRDKRQKREPKYILGDLVRTAYIKTTFSKGDSKSWSYDLYTTSEVIHDKIPS